MSYTLLDKIGQGGMGCVYKAKDNTSNNVVAIKMMSNSVTCYPEYRDLFYSEVDTLRRMDHPSVVHIVGDPYKDSAGNMYLPMEFVEGETIEHKIKTSGPLSVDEANSMMCAILEAIQYVHNRGRIHRDIKPSNIMIRPNGNICVIDFGIAKDARVGSGGNTVGKIIGTDGYMSPEQATGLNIDRRTDIYSLGCVYYYLLTARHAIQKGVNSYQTINSILYFIAEPPSTINPAVPKEIDAVVAKAMDKNMTLRYQSSSEFKEAIESACGQSVPKVTIGSSPDNDIVINNQYVSRHHLIIKGTNEPLTGGGFQFSIELTDNSTNGTGVNGRPLKRRTMSIVYNDTADLPEVLLAARAECPLDWNQVITILKQKGWQPQKISTPPTISKQASGTSIGGVEEEGLNSQLAIVCFFFPLIGLILWLVWRNEKPKKGKSAGQCTLCGFILNIILILISL